MIDFIKWVLAKEGILTGCSCAMMGIGLGFYHALGLMGAILYFNLLARNR